TEPAERFLVAGKINNLRIAVNSLNGIEIPAGEVFSFWKHVGRSSRFRGFVAGRELREGCIIPNVGGGLCQLSNALYDAALDADLEIVERHAHTQTIAGSLAEKDRDATVFWNYVDLRFRSHGPLRIDAQLDSSDLLVRFKGAQNGNGKLHKLSPFVGNFQHPRSCATCEMDCHRVVAKPTTANFGRTAFLVDDVWPEFDIYIQNVRTKNDLFLLPLDGKRFKKSNYAWNTNGFDSVKQSLVPTAIRSYRSRKLAAQGAARQRNLLAMYEMLARSYAKRLKYDVLHVVVQQNLLPFLWRDGHLGGRTFDVLMSALPMNELQRTLDAAAKLHPESTTLGDFRAESWLVDTEAEALAHASKVITPHTHIAALFRERAELIDWQMPDGKPRTKSQNEKPVIVFPASTLGRKGCYELRDAIRGLDLRLLIIGPSIESASFWEGFNAERGGDDWLNYADLVVIPAYVEHRPRRLLAAAANGVPVLASENCGVSGVDGIEIIPAGDAEALRRAISARLPAR
ncbi:MAG: VanW family protein, partial [Pyrinomonadaceae bacterium]